MIELYDFTNCELSERDLQYGGRAGEKRGIIFNNENWFLKFPKTTVGMSGIKNLSYVTSPLGEYIGCQIFKILGYNVQDTKLGICFDGKRYKLVCACRDFIIDDKNDVLIPYTSLRNDSSPKIMSRMDSVSPSPSNLNEILFHLENNTILKKIPNAKQIFWDTLIIDILINNNDRHEDNWGVIRHKNTNTFEMAPIYDCGNSFYGKADEEKIMSLLNNNERLEDSAINCITAYENDDGNLFQISKIVDLKNKDLKLALYRVYSKVIANYTKINELIDNIPNLFKNVEIISNERKEYYKQTFKIRLKCILEKQIEKINKRENSQSIEIDL